MTPEDARDEAKAFCEELLGRPLVHVERGPRPRPGQLGLFGQPIRECFILTFGPGRALGPGGWGERSVTFGVPAFELRRPRGLNDLRRRFTDDGVVPAPVSTETTRKFIRALWTVIESQTTTASSRQERSHD